MNIVESNSIININNSTYYFSFWTKFKDYFEKLSNINSSFTLAKPSTKNYIDLKYGSSEHHIVIRRSLSKNTISSELYIRFDNALFSYLKTKLLHNPIFSFDDKPSSKSMRIIIAVPFNSALNDDSWFEWIINQSTLLHSILIESQDDIYDTIAISKLDKYYEGAVTTITVNKYERNADARNKCLEHYGCTCQVCNLNFLDKYGKVGKGFIHVHHIVALHEISEEYQVDPINDLIPICPNCHSMLHRKIDGQYLSIDELKSCLKF